MNVGFPCGSAGKESTCSAGDLGLIAGLGRSSGEGKGCPLQYSGLENSMDCIVHGVAKSRTGLSNFHFPSAMQWSCGYLCFCPGTAHPAGPMSWTAPHRRVTSTSFWIPLGFSPIHWCFRWWLAGVQGMGTRWQEEQIRVLRRLLGAVFSNIL